MIKYDIGGEYLTERALRYIENDLRVPVKPRYSFNVKFDAENKRTVEYTEYPGTHPSFAHFSKMEIARDVKEHLCRLSEKSEGSAARYYDIINATILS